MLQDNLLLIIVLLLAVSLLSMMSEKLHIDPQELLMRAVQKLEAGWTKNKFYGRDDRGGATFCIRGALEATSVEADFGPARREVTLTRSATMKAE